MSIFEYDEEKHMRLEREEHYSAGLHDGISIGCTDTLLLLLEDFHPLPLDLVTKIKETTDNDMLHKWVKLAKKAASLEEFVENM